MKTTKKSFFLNGEKYFVTSNVTIFDIIKYFNYNTQLLVLEYNHSICDRKNWNKIKLQKNDILEIVTIVGGG